MDQWISKRESSKIIFFLETIVLEFAPSEIGSLNKDRLGRKGHILSRSEHGRSDRESFQEDVEQIFSKRVKRIRLSFFFE